MKMFLLVLLAMVALPIQNSQTQTSDDSQIAVLSFKWSKSRQSVRTSGADNPVPARAMTQADKANERNARVNDPAGMRDPNADTLDARSTALEKNVRSASEGSKTVNGFAYQAKIHNGSKQVVEFVFWEYQFIDPANPGEVTRRQFLCGVNLKPGKDKELQAFSVSGPPNTVDARTPGNTFREQVLINRVEFTDGKSWMRKDWNGNEIKSGYERAMATPWAPNEMCRAL